MFAARKLNSHSFTSASSLLQFNPSKNALLRDVSAKVLSSNVVQPSKPSDDCLSSSSRLANPFDGWSRSMSTSRGSSSMRSKVAKRMQKESGKTLREVRRAKKLQKKLMTENERLIYNLKRAKRKVALLLQKLKKYELPDLPAPRHDPELVTVEQLQALKKIGFKNKNYVPVGVRGVFGGVVQNMHLHWKFHETVQVCCDNFPKEKIKEMASMIARLSGGIVVNIHNTKTIIMFRGRNYRQPKNLIPFNTLTKRKALFKARFEQALESQKLNIKKIEQQLRRSGINPEDPVAIASIQRVASSFFNAIDQKDGSPYVFHGDKPSVAEPDNKFKHPEPPDEEEEEELDKFIAEIEDAAEREWAAEEAAEKEEFTRMRYWNREEYGGRYRRSEEPENDDSDDEIPRVRDWRQTHGKQRPNGDYEDDNEEWRSNNVVGSSVLDSDADDSDGTPEKFKISPRDWGRQNKIGRAKNDECFYRNSEANNRKASNRKIMVDVESENVLSDLDTAMWKFNSEEEHDSTASRAANYDFRSSSDEEEDLTYTKGGKEWVNDSESNSGYSNKARGKFEASRVAEGKHDRRIGRCNSEYFKRNADVSTRRKPVEEDVKSKDISGDSENEIWESNAASDSGASTTGRIDYNSSDEEDYQVRREEKKGNRNKSTRTRKDLDEDWDSD
ncbi:CRM domain-containing protein [Pyrus ussuriensis x Pyrus communis]|uniref:CRM domain-containing protein n=1 Tax=Pyrus ussuriensis x Pyrus communis TaxID=2448454 RepID=A0A5N5G9P5_9ROSA|nr:CRM domain-containing protein [Pyrus ussuriensis x Pyrus communis]